MKKTLILFLMMSTAILCSCKSNDDETSKTDRLCSAPWSYQRPDCKEKNKYTFFTNSTFTFLYACSGLGNEDSEEAQGKWKFTESETKLILTFDDESGKSTNTIIEFTDTRLALKVDEGGDISNITLTR